VLISENSSGLHMPRTIVSKHTKKFIASVHYLENDGDVHRFLKVHLLHWIEALSWLGKTSDVIRLLGSLQSIVIVSQAPMYDLDIVH
jgi:hypothetical protein